MKILCIYKTGLKLKGDNKLRTRIHSDHSRTGLAVDFSCNFSFAIFTKTSRDHIQLLLWKNWFWSLIFKYHKLHLNGWIENKLPLRRIVVRQTMHTGWWWWWRRPNEVKVHLRQEKCSHAPNPSKPHSPQALRFKRRLKPRLADTKKGKEFENLREGISSTTHRHLYHLPSNPVGPTSVLERFQITSPCSSSIVPG